MPAAMPMSAERGVIFDVGMHDGIDTASYLAQGYDVLAIEGNPALAADAIPSKSPPSASRDIIAEYRVPTYL